MRPGRAGPGGSGPRERRGAEGRRDDAVLLAGAGAVAGLRHLRNLLARPRPAGVFRAAGAEGGQRGLAALLVGRLRPLLRRRRPQHLLHRHRVGAALPGWREAAGSAAALLDPHHPQPQVRLRDAAVPEAGGAHAGAVVRTHHVARLHPSAAPHDQGLPRELSLRGPPWPVTAQWGWTQGLGAARCSAV